MAKKSRVRAVTYPEKPQAYEHRVDAAIEALNQSLIGAAMLVKFLLEQQGHEWKKRTDLVVAARSNLRRSLFWLSKIKTGNT